MSVVDVVIGLQNGDEGKGKITNKLVSSGNYDCVLRFNGGGNAGHTIYQNGQKIVTHLVPCGILHGIHSVIGNGCVLNINSFFEEVSYLKKFGFDTSLIKIAKNVHIVTDKHKSEELNESRIGTTKTGNGPAYRDKYNRTGIRAESCRELKDFMVDMYDVIYSKNKRFLAEGAQAYGLDIDWGEYPYVTSSHCGVGSVLLNGFNHNQIGDVIGVIKAYDTYVGGKKFEPKENVFELIRKIGGEYGATTGRPRQCNWLNWKGIQRACDMNGVNKIIMNKVDILNAVKEWKLYNNEIVSFNSEEEFRGYLGLISQIPIQFEYSPY